MHELHIHKSLILYMIHDDEDAEKQKYMTKIAFCQYFKDPPKNSLIMFLGEHVAPLFLIAKLPLAPCSLSLLAHPNMHVQISLGMLG